MGIPGFFPWLLSRYPRIVGAKPDRPENVYLDVNGLIHECCQLPDGRYDTNEAASLERLVGLVEGLVRELQPTGLLYLSVDGVAPRAKSNQQRERRYESARGRTIQLIKDLHKEKQRALEGTMTPPGTPPSVGQGQSPATPQVVQSAESAESPSPSVATPAKEVPQVNLEKRDLLYIGQTVRLQNNAGWGIITEILEEVVKAEVLPGRTETHVITYEDLMLGAADVSVPTAPSPYHVWDSNAVTCGTIFMDKCTERLKQWALECERSAGLQILVSGVRSPGEGEHKFIDFIKRERDERSGWYRPNATHVLVSGDTDLLLLALALHEPNVIVARQNSAKNSRAKVVRNHDFSYIYASLFREYLCEELCGKINKCHDLVVIHEQSKKIAALKTFVLPPLVALIALLFAFKRNEIAALAKGVLSGEIVVDRRKVILVLIAVGVAVRFVRKQKKAVPTAASERKRIQAKQKQILKLDAERVLDDFVIMSTLVGNDFMPHAPAVFAQDFSMSTVIDAYVRAMGKISGTTKNIEYLTENTATSCGWNYALSKNVLIHTFKELGRVENCLMDEGPNGAWKVPYYDSVFEAGRESLTLSAQGNPQHAVESPAQLKAKMCENFVEGLCFMSVYYLSPDVASWEWCYRQYYAPACSDIAEYLESGVKLSSKVYLRRSGHGEMLYFPHDGSTPLKPSQQLVVVLPPASFALIPSENGSRAVAQSQKGEAFHPLQWRVDNLVGGFQAVSLLPIVETPAAADVAVEESPEWLVTDSPSIAGGRLEHDAGKLHKFFPNSALQANGMYLRRRAELTQGTTPPPFTAVRRVGYTGWVAPEELDYDLADGAEDVKKLVLVFPEKMPFPPVVVRNVRKMFGASIRTVNKPHDKRYDIVLPRVDADKAELMLQRNGLYHDTEKQLTYFDEFLVKITVEVSPKQSLYYCNIEIPGSPRAQSEIKFFDLQDLFRVDFRVNPAGHIKIHSANAVVPILEKDVVSVTRRLADRRTRIVKGKQIILNDPQKEYPGVGLLAPAPHTIHPLDMALNDFFGTSLGSYQDWICASCFNRSCGKHSRCRQCRTPRSPVFSLPLTLRSGSDRTNHYKPDHTPFVELIRPFSF